MGRTTRRELAEAAEETGIHPATGDRAAVVAEMKDTAVQLLEVLVLEEAGIRDGDGTWKGSDPVHGLVDRLVEQAVRLEVSES